jgi:hypothetical protein
VALNALQHILELSTSSAFQLQLHTPPPWFSSPRLVQPPGQAHLLCLCLRLSYKFLQPRAELRLLLGRG